MTKAQKNGMKFRPHLARNWSRRDSAGLFLGEEPRLLEDPWQTDLDEVCTEVAHLPRSPRHA